MKFVESDDYEKAVKIIKSEMASYYVDLDLTWDDDKKLALYRECSLWTILDNQDLGFAMTHEINGQFFLAELHIESAFRNKRYGEESLKLANELAANLGYKEIRIKVFKSSPAYRLYLRSGYLLEKELPYTFQLVAKTHAN